MRRHPVAIAAAILAVLTVLWGLDAALGDGIYWAHDLRHHHMPWRAWAAGEWLAGRVPWWAPDVASGFPLLADGQAGALYPPTMLLFMALPPALALNYSVLLHVWWAGLGAFMLARSHHLRPQAALVGAIAFAFSGFLASHTVYLGMQNAVAWLPWALWAIMARRWGWLGVATFMMAVAGHPQAAAFGLLLCGATTLWQRQILPFALAVGLGLLAASPQLLATVQLTDFGMRQGGVDAVFSNIGALPPQELINAVLPDSFGHDTPADVLQTYYHRGEGYWGQGLNHWEMCFFLGIPTVALGVFAVARRWRLREDRRAVVFWSAVAVTSLLLMLGNLGVLWQILHRLPGLDGFRFPVRFSLVLTVAASVLAALGTQELMQAPTASLRRTSRALVGVAAVLFVAFGTARVGLMAVQEPLRAALTGHYSARLDLPPPPPEIANNPLRDVLFPGAELEPAEKIPGKVQHILDDLAYSTLPWSPRVLFPVGMLLGLAGLLSLRDRVGPGRTALLVGALVYADLWRFGADYNGRWPRSFVESKPQLLSAVDFSHRQRFSVVDRRQDPALDVQLMTSSLGLMYGSHDVILTTPLLILRSELMLWRTGLDVGDKGPQKWERLAAHPKLIDILGVRWLSSVHDVKIDGLRAVGTFADGAVHLYENVDARPPAWLAGCAQVATTQAVDDDPIGFLDSLDPDLPLVEAQPGSLSLPACSSSSGFGSGSISPGSVTLVDDQPQRMVFDVDAARPALMVQNDTWYPGWTATVDDRPVPIYRTLFAFRGLAIPAGQHRVVLAYDPGRLGLLLLLSPVCLLILVLMGFMSGRRRPARGSVLS